MIIGLYGAQGSGKDTIANIMVENTDLLKYHSHPR